jgi:hypothetical protein
MKRASEKISAVFEFSKTGMLRAIFLNAENENDQKVLEQGLFVLLKPDKFTSLKRLFRGLKG